MGWVYDLVNQDAATSAPAIIGVGVFLTTLSLSILSLRLYVRARIVRIVTIGMNLSEDFFCDVSLR